MVQSNAYVDCTAANVYDVKQQLSRLCRKILVVAQSKMLWKNVSTVWSVIPPT